MEQDVVVKVEDELGIFVKEEESFIGVASTSTFDEDASIDLENLLVEPRPHFLGVEEFQKELLVYTRKLDDMSVWKYLRKYKYPKRILNRIITESKPAFPRIFKKKKKKKRKSIVKFNKFTSNLQVYKEMVAEEERRRIPKNCPPQVKNKQSYKAEFNNEKQKQRIIQSINIDDDDDSDDDDDGDDDDDSDVITAHDDSSIITTDDEETDIISTVSVNTNVTPFTPTAVDHQVSIRYIVIIHTLNSPYDVYFVNNVGIPTEFYRFGEESHKSILVSSYDHYHTIKQVHVNNCCWFVRGYRLKHINIECSSILYTFMRRQHGCDIGNCKCCCQRKYNYLGQLSTPKPAQRTVRSQAQNRWHIRLMSRRAQQNQNSLINTALAHKPKIKCLKEKEQKRVYYSNLCLKLKLNNKLTHSYYLGRNGLINTYIRPNYLCTLRYLKDMIGWFYSTPNENICCLTEYKKYCLKLIRRAHPTVIKFLTNSLLNEPNKCATCENLEIQNAKCVRGQVVPLYLPKYPRHTKPWSKVITRAFNILEKGKNRQPDTNFNTKAMKSILPKTAGKNTTTSIASIEKNIAPNLINLGIGKLGLGIFPGGKVKILSKTSPDEISTENLKILRGIVQHAQNKVISQDFNPSQLIFVNNLFTQDPQEIKKQQLESKEISTNILRTALNSTENVHNQQFIASKNIQNNKDNILNNNIQPVNQSKVLVQETELNLIRRDKNVYQVLRNISAEKRRQYLISHEFLRNADIKLWVNVNMLGNEQEGDKVYTTKENNKRKTTDKGSSPPPKQIRSGSSENSISFVPIVSTNTTFLPTTSLNISTKTIQQPEITTFLSTLPNPSLQQIVPTVPLPQLQVNNTSFPLPENVTVIPIGQLPQELVTDLYKKFAFLPENTQSLNVQAQPLNPIDVTEHLFPTTSSRDNSISMPSPSLPNRLMTSDIPSTIPIIQTMQVENIESDVADAQDDDCILGV